MKYRTVSVIAAAALAVSACSLLPGRGEPADTRTPAERYSYKSVSFAGERATASERSACEALGGEVMQAGILGADNCIQSLPDAGNACTDSSDCIGQCLATEDTTTDFGVDAVGECQATDNPFGCFTLVTHGKYGPGLCVD